VTPTDYIFLNRFLYRFIPLPCKLRSSTVLCHCPPRSSRFVRRFLISQRLCRCIGYRAEVSQTCNFNVDSSAETMSQFSATLYFPLRSCCCGLFIIRTFPSPGVDVHLRPLKKKTVYFTQRSQLPTSGRETPKPPARILNSDGSGIRNRFCCRSHEGATPRQFFGRPKSRSKVALYR